MRSFGIVCAAAFLLLFVACDDSSPGAGGCEEGESVTMDSGLEYEDIECGDGAEVERGDIAVVHYTGTLEDGTEFDSSRGGEPFRAVLESGNLIEGWIEGIPGMKVGGRRELTIPPELGYGEAGYPPDIPPNATLVFDVEVLEVVDR